MARWDESNYYDEPDDGMRSARALGFAILWSIGTLVGILVLVFWLMART
jgi:hypothetical protein